MDKDTKRDIKRILDKIIEWLFIIHMGPIVKAIELIEKTVGKNKEKEYMFITII